MCGTPFMDDSITEETLRALIAAGGVRALVAVPQTHPKSKGQVWALTAKVGLKELILRSKREPIRYFSSLDTLAGFVLGFGALELVVHLR